MTTPLSSSLFQFGCELMMQARPEQPKKICHCGDEMGKGICLAGACVTCKEMPEDCQPDDAEPAADLPAFLWEASPRDRMAAIEAEIVSEGRAHVNTRPNRKTD